MTDVLPGAALPAPALLREVVRRLRRFEGDTSEGGRLDSCTLRHLRRRERLDSRRQGYLSQDERLLRRLG